MKKLCWLFITFFIVGLNEVGLSQDLPESKERQSSENQTLTKEAPASKDAPAPEEPSFSKTSHIELNFSGEMSIWGSNFKKNKTYNTYGARYLPLLTAKVPLGEDYNLDAQASVNILLNKKFESATRYEIERKLDLYRFTARVFSQAQEVRFGLQRINFGPGKILRAMQWFDNINPTDVTNFTEGVWGGLFRKYFENNLIFGHGLC